MPRINLRTPAVYRNKLIHVHHTQTPWKHGHLNNLCFVSKSLPSPFKITLKNKRLSAVVINWIEMMMPLSLLGSFAEVVSKPPRHCPSCVKRCRCAYTGGTWLLRCCQLLLHACFYTPSPFPTISFKTEPVSLWYHLVFCQWVATINKIFFISKMFS